HTVSPRDRIEAGRVRGDVLHIGESRRAPDMMEEPHFLVGLVGKVDAAQASEGEHFFARRDLGWCAERDLTAAVARRVLVGQSTGRDKRERGYDGHDGRNERT